MPWTYSQRTGELRHNGALVATGYSGTGAGLNNPAMQGVQDVGPLPQGTYAVTAPFHHPHAGAYALRLTPAAGTNTLRRSGFLIHGDSRAHPGQASNGCIIENLQARHQIWNSQDHTITVTP